MGSNDFDWCDKSYVAIPNVSAIAVYQNDNDEVVIRQQNMIDEDSVIVLPKEQLYSLIKALERVETE